MIKDITVAEVLVRKKVAEDQIAKALEDFQGATGINITDLRLCAFERRSITDRAPTVCVTGVKIDLKL
jgi:hypothetical protein